MKQHALCFVFRSIRFITGFENQNSNKNFPAAQLLYFLSFNIKKPE